ncbi:2852_t:CDS:2, partial [Funneliformis mosseae]
DSVGSFFVYDKYTDEDYKVFWLLSIIEEGAAFRFKTFPEDSIPVLSQVNQFNQLKIRSETFRSTLSFWHANLAKNLACFILNDNTSDVYPGQPAENHKTRFHCKTDEDYEKSCNGNQNFMKLEEI